MTTSLDILKIARQNVLKLIDGLSLEKLNKIPEGFTGNIVWHVGHLVATQQGLLYTLSGNATNLDKSYIDKYKKGSKPEAPVTQAELDFILAELIRQPEQLEKDMAANKFANYNQYSTSFGNTIHNFDEALSFVGVHEGMHIGYIMALKRCL